MAHFGPYFAEVINLFDLARHEREKELLWERIRREGIFFRGKRDEGFVYKGKAYITHTWTDEIVGSNYKPSTRNCCCLPWEDCPH